MLFSRKNCIVRLDADDKIDNNIKEIRKALSESLKTKSYTDTIKDEFELIDEALVTNEFNLIWNNRLITGGYRAWRKKITNAIWKNEILNSDKLDDLFVYNYKKEFDWITTLEFISNRINFSSRQCGDKDTKDRSYRIKNILKELPTYKTLYKRNTNKIASPKCIRCGKKEEEDWDHVWICDDNEFSIDDIIQESPYKFELELVAQNKDKDIEILRNYLCNFLTILESPSIILRGKSRKWELIRGVFNNNFNNISKIKEEKTVIKELWNFIYDEIKKRIRIPRCDEIKRLEEKEEIKKSDLRLKKQVSEDNQNEILETENITLGKLTGALTDGINIDRKWDTIYRIVYFYVRKLPVIPFTIESTCLAEFSIA
uniref:Uncharacterized protein n=1 Tax=Rhizophagus irregularis (strain DAOM 181602 / DAOM 197198 / MUCL 43194) TaxID=747089 RepID=U9TL67_RHIID